MGHNGILDLGDRGIIGFSLLEVWRFRGLGDF